MRNLVEYIKESSNENYILYIKNYSSSLYKQAFVDETIFENSISNKYKVVNIRKNSSNLNLQNTVSFIISGISDNDNTFRNVIPIENLLHKNEVRLYYKQIYRNEDRFDFSNDQIKNERNIDGYIFIDIDNSKFLVLNKEDVINNLKNNSISLDEVRKLNHLSFKINDEDVDFYNDVYSNDNNYKEIIDKYYKVSFNKKPYIIKK